MLVHKVLKVFKVFKVRKIILKNRQHNAKIHYRVDNPVPRNHPYLKLLLTFWPFGCIIATGG